MPDINLRFHKDILVLSSPVDHTLRKQGVDIEQDREFLSLVEPDLIRDAMRLEIIGGAQCLVTNTAGITAARLTHINMEERSFELATAATTIARSLKPQHLLVEIGPTGLPLDSSSKTSLMQNRKQYERACKDFGSEEIDAFFLNGMTTLVDMQCALMGIRGVSEALIFASVKADSADSVGGRDQSVEEAASLMSEYGAAVVGFETKAPLKEAIALAERAKRATDLPLLMQLEVTTNNPQQMAPTEDNPYCCADVMVEAALALQQAGVQFLRASGNATPAYTSALVATSAGNDVVL